MLHNHEYNQFISIAITFFLLLDMWFPILFYFTEKKDNFSFCDTNLAFIF